MKLTAILSDIHSNDRALDAVLLEADRLGCGRYVCLGDIVGYGAKPNHCVTRLLEVGSRCIMGNHDALVAGVEKGLGFNPYSLAAAEANRRDLTAENLDLISRLPGTLQLDSGVLACHGSPDSWNRYLLNSVDLEETAGDRTAAGDHLVFFGHTHCPVFFQDNQSHDLSHGAFLASADKMTLVNPGSVGQPRDRDPRAAFVVWDPDTGSIAFQRVAYDVEGARQDILDAGLPLYLGDRLREGR